MKIVAVEPIGITLEKEETLISMFKDKGATFQVYKDRNENPDILTERMRDADAVIISNIPLSRDILSQCPQLKWLIVAFTGLDHIDMEYCAMHNIKVRNAAGYATTAVAELAIGLMLDLLRKITELDRITRNGGTRNNFLGRELHGKCVGVIGTGAIGTATAKLLKAFGCRVMAWNRTEHKEILQNGIKYYTIDEIMQQADIITIHLPLNEDTFHFISRERLRLCKYNTLIINTARGNVVDINAMAEMLKTGELGGAAFDVYEKEPPLSTNHVLMEAPNCILIPHVGYATREAFDYRIDICISNLLEETGLTK